MESFDQTHWTMILKINLLLILKVMGYYLLLDCLITFYCVVFLLFADILWFISIDFRINGFDDEAKSMKWKKDLCLCLYTLNKKKCSWVFCVNTFYRIRVLSFVSFINSLLPISHSLQLCVHSNAVNIQPAYYSFLLVLIY